MARETRIIEMITSDLALWRVIFHPDPTEEDQSIFHADYAGPWHADSAASEYRLGLSI